MTVDPGFRKEALPMQGTNVVGVQFRRAGKIYDFSSEGVDVSVGDFVVVNSDRGPSLAEVVAVRFLHPTDKTEKKLKPIVRRASQKELSRPTRLTPEFVSEFTLEQVKKHKLKMKVLKSEVQFGGSKVIVYFTAPGRVDFRELVKDLASGLKTRIELKQIGARDETKLLGGLGICGREYCCSSFLREFVPVSIRMAKNQNLALNPSKVSGGCGRLLCCLTYENKTYSSLRTSLPPRGTRVRVLSSDQTGVVLKSDLLNQVVAVEGAAGDQFEAKVTDIEVLDQKKGRGKEPDPLTEELDPDAVEWAAGLDLDELSQEVSGLEDPESKKPHQGDSRRRQDHRGKRPPRGGARGRPGEGQQARRDQGKRQNESGEDSGEARGGKKPGQGRSGRRNNRQGRPGESGNKKHFQKPGRDKDQRQGPPAQSRSNNRSQQNDGAPDKPDHGAQGDNRQRSAQGPKKRFRPKPGKD